MVTITNARVQLCRVLKAEGYIDQLCEESPEGIMSWLDERAGEYFSNMAIAGDDCVVGTNTESYGTALEYINANGKVRK